MTSSNGNIFRVTGPLCGEFTGPGEFPTQRPVTRSFHVFFDLRLNKRLSKQSRGWWFETLSHPLWRHRNEYRLLRDIAPYEYRFQESKSIDEITGLDDFEIPETVAATVVRVPAISESISYLSFHFHQWSCRVFFILTTLVQVMACCQMVPSNYMNQYWLIVTEALEDCPENISTRNIQYTKQRCPRNLHI